MTRDQWFFTRLVFAYRYELQRDIYGYKLYHDVIDLLSTYQAGTLSPVTLNYALSSGTLPAMTLDYELATVCSLAYHINHNAIEYQYYAGQIQNAVLSPPSG